MTMYIWQRVKYLTSNWHHEGGLVVVAKGDLEHARQLFRDSPLYQEKLANFPQQEECTAFTVPPDFVYDAVGDDPEERVLSFPDAGCC